MGDGRKKYGPSNPRLPVFFERFRDLVDKNGGISRVADITGISRPTITFWYNGQRTPDAENLIILSERFDKSVDFLLGVSNVDTLDIDRKKVCKYTGLSAKAVSKLREWNTSAGGQFLSGAMDDIIVSDEIVDFLISLHSLRGTAATMRECCDCMESGTFSAADKFGSRAGAFRDDYDRMRLMRFQVSESLDGLIEDLYSYRAICKRCEPLFSELVHKEVPDDVRREALEDALNGVLGGEENGQH